MTLRTRLMLSSGAVVLASFVAVYLGSTRVVSIQFEQVRTPASVPLDRSVLARRLAAHHASHGWRGVEKLLTNLRDTATPARDLLLVDADAKLLAASGAPRNLRVERHDPNRLQVTYSLGGNPTRYFVRGSGIDVAAGAQLYVVPKWSRHGGPSPAEEAKHWLFVIVVVSGLAALLSTFAVARTVVRPIERLHTAVERVAGGKLGEQVAITSRDEVGKLAGAFNAMSARLAHNEVLRRNMVDDVAHELRTPLTNAICAVEAIQDGLRKPEPAVIASLHDDLTLLQCLVDDLQTLALAEAGQLPLHIETLSVEEEVERCVRPLSDRVVVDIEPGLRVAADRMRFQQILTNLVRNALMHARSASRIAVTARAHEREVEVVVADDGEGIAAEHLPHIFDRFYRADPSRNRASGGAGLGLAIVRNLVELHGGRIDARSERGGGASFHIHLPIP